jgi:hypothetical protein
MNIRAWDIDDIHPNFKLFLKIEPARHFAMTYHHGHKTKKNGKKYYIEPILLEQEGIYDWKFTASLWDAIVAAPSLKAACELSDLKPKSKGDLSLIRREAQALTFDKVVEGCDKEWIPPPVGWDPKNQTLIIVGAPLLGKTNWAMSQFTKPCVFTELKDLKNIVPGCNGMIFDDIDCAQLKFLTQKSIFDCRARKSIRARNVILNKPHLPAIFCTNNLERCFDLKVDNGAIAIRTFVWHVHTKMYIE